MLFSDTQFGQVQLRKALNVILLGIHRTDNHAHCTRVVRNRIYQYEGTGRTVLLIGIEKYGFCRRDMHFPDFIQTKTVCRTLHIEPDALSAIVATGYGRNNIPFATRTKTEITCHARGAHALNPAVRTIIDIGGQDSKVIRLNEDGSVKNFVMNDKCAAGTGRFLEMMARTLGLSLEEMSTKGLEWKENIVISSMCTVFAESEVVSLVAQNKDVADIIHGLNVSVASKVGALAARLGKKNPGEYMMTGGVAKNPGIIKALEEKLDAKLYICDEAQLCGALGAALFAYEKCSV